MKILVVGGAGYVGSHTVRLLQSQGHEVWVFDNFSRGHRESVPSRCLIEGNLTDRALLIEVMRDKEIDAVMHFAAFALVGESVQHPAMYYQNNVSATFELLEAMRSVGVWRFVFSSTTATYGQPEKMPISEDTPQNPINPYGFTKLVVERALEDYAHAYGFGVAALRYFNASGAAADGTIGEDHDPESHLIPIVLQVALGQRPNVSIFGNDYPTPDGTCIRDYIHVDDLASAHLAALMKLQPNSVLQMNLGTGVGHSVLQVVEACRKVTGHPIPTVDAPRREGDPACLIADSTKAQRELQWKPKYVAIEDIVSTAWKWHQSHPRGYAS
ncbi:UDP-glucose 4-epimerase [Pirellula sp. SH-Sr6A]|uniref:UDP-glucose 4-epimerase GalE n=1 Tax=Pirellula sp. SH-Sr6A TaxID=1632865 RepID=UPI00078B8C02|nr:UDP-glucose 4-epimerase GalE [Pirellula sp. SH-Sr6A]AMV32431.1 UDP-glucose 4-epimerase [Pirellula sp. SH-Sr6A]